MCLHRMWKHLKACRYRKGMVIIMKKRTAVLFAVLLAVGMLAGCGNEAEQNTEGTTGTEQTVEQTTENTGANESTDATQNTADVETVLLKDMDVAQYVSFSSDYTGLAISVAAREVVTDEDVNAFALQVYSGSATAEAGGITDRAVEIGDNINLDYAGYEDGVAFEGGTATNQTLVIGSGSFIEGFEEGLVGVMPGETVDLNLSFPENYYNADMAGKAVVFTVTVNFIYPAAFEDMTDETVAVITGGEQTTVDAFVAYCKEYLEYEAEYEYTVAKQNAVISALEAIAVVESVPAEVTAKYVENVMLSLNSQAAQYGVDADSLCSYFYGMDAASYAAQAAESSARQGMYLQHIANEQNLNVNDADLETELAAFAEENGVTVDDLLVKSTKEDFREYFTFERVADFVFDNAQVTEN